MTIISTQIPEKLHTSLCDAAEYLDRSKSYLIREALEAYLQELQEDIEDYNDAVKILAQNNPSYSLEEVIRESNLEQELDIKTDELDNKN